MAHLTSTIPLLGRPGFEWIELGMLEDVEDQYSQIFGAVSSTNKDYEDYRALSDLNYANQIDEGDSVIVDSVTAPFNMQVRPVMRGTAFEISKQAKYTDLYNKVKNPLRRMGAAMKETRNLVGANVLALGFTAPASGGTQTMDGLALFSNVHTVESGTASNSPSTALPFNAVNLETAKTQLRQQVSHRGKPMVNSGRVKLFVPPSLEFAARRVVESLNQAGTADNDKNVVGASVSVNVLDYITTSTLQDAWYLVMGNNAKNPLCWLNRIALHMEEDYDTKTKMHLYTAGEEYAVFARDWRGTWGTNP